MTKSRRNMIILIGGLIIAVLIAGGSGAYYVTKSNHHKSLVKEYDNAFSAIQTASAAFKSQLDTPPADAKTLQGMITFYTDLNAKNTFESQVKELNVNPQYASLEADERKGPEVLDLAKAAEKLAGKLKDIEKLQGIMQRSTNLDTEIGELAKQTGSTDSNAYTKSEDLTKRNNGLKDEMLSLVLSDPFKEVQSAFAQALNSRGIAIDELRKINSEMWDYRNSVRWFDEQIKWIDGVLNAAQDAPDNLFQIQIKRGYTEMDQVKRARADVDKDWDEVNGLKEEADKQMASYRKLIGLPAADSLVALKQEVRPSASDVRATIFMHDYLRKGMMALSSKNFYIVQPYLEQDGKQYWEQYNYMDYLQSKGISEKLVSVEVKSVEPADTNNVKVTTSEKYDISYSDGTRKLKTFTTAYKLKKAPEDSFLVTELVSTTETESVDK